MSNNNAQVNLDAAPIESPVTPKTPVEKEPIPVVHAVGADAVQIQNGVADLAASLGGGDSSSASELSKGISDKNTRKDTLITNAVRALLGAPDLHINQVMMGKRDLEYLDGKLRDLYPTEDDAKAAKEDDLSLFNLLISAFRDGWGSNQAKSIIDCLTMKNSDGKSPLDALVNHKDEKSVKLGDGTAHHLKTGTVDLKGPEARDAFMTEISGMKKVKLLNSGFWVTLRRPLIHELQDIFDAADMEQTEVGYSIGAHFALAADTFIKQKFCEALIKHRIIRNSNLADIFNTKDHVFYKALAFHDYEVLVHAVLALMTRKGMRARVVCPECNRATILEKVDIASAKFYNLDLINPKVHEWFDKETDENGKPLPKKTLVDLKKYREEILGFSYSWTEDFEPTKVRINFSVPTMDKYFEIGAKLCRMIQDTIDETSVDDEDRRQVILANLGAHTYHMLTPWVETIEIVDDDGNVSKRTADVDTILNTFDIQTQENSVRPLEELAKFLASSKISYIGTFALECPYCHAKPDVGANQFYPLEVQTIFFGQLFRALPAELMPQEA